MIQCFDNTKINNKQSKMFDLFTLTCYEEVMFDSIKNCNFIYDYLKLFIYFSRSLNLKNKKKMIIN